MGQHSLIQWCDHTFNPWRGCTVVSAGCRHCYAETWSRRNPRVLGVWGKDGHRVVAAPAYWREPITWDADAKAAGVRRRVFCASLADVFEGAATMPSGVYGGAIRNARARLFQLIERTPNLDWLLLTRRPQNIMRQIDEVYRECLVRKSPWPLRNVWLGTSCENQAAADERSLHLMACPAAVRFLSLEPLLGPIDLDDVLRPSGGSVSGSRIDWVIVGGESGPGARPFDVLWARSILDQCRQAGVACFVKQLGSKPMIGDTSDPRGWPVSGGPVDWETGAIELSDPKGGNPAEWPAELRVRQVPSPGGDSHLPAAT